jgi:hypothetical protein
MAIWYYYNESGERVQVGSNAELKKLAETGKIQENTIITHESGKSVSAGKIKGLDFLEHKIHATLSQPEVTIVPPPHPVSRFRSSIEVLLEIVKSKFGINSNINELSFFQTNKKFCIIVGCILILGIGIIMSLIISTNATRKAEHNKEKKEQLVLLRQKIKAEEEKKRRELEPKMLAERIEKEKRDAERKAESERIKRERLAKIEAEKQRVAQQKKDKVPKLKWKQCYFSQEKNVINILEHRIKFDFTNEGNKEILWMVVEIEFFIPGREKPLDVVKKSLLTANTSRDRMKYEVNVKPGDQCDMVYKFNNFQYEFPSRDDIYIKFRVVKVEYLDGTQWEDNGQPWIRPDDF